MEEQRIVRLRTANQPAHRVCDVLLRGQLACMLGIVCEKDDIFRLVRVAIYMRKGVSYVEDVAGYRPNSQMQRWKGEA